MVLHALQMADLNGHLLQHQLLNPLQTLGSFNVYQSKSQIIENSEIFNFLEIKHCAFSHDAHQLFGMKDRASIEHKCTGLSIHSLFTAYEYICNDASGYAV